MSRLPYLDRTSAEPETAAALDALPPLNVFQMLAHAQTAFRPWLRYGAALLAELELDPGLRELAILEVAQISDSEYEWVQHEAIALGVGLNQAKVDAIRDGATGPLTDEEEAVVAFTADVVSHVRASDDTLAAVRGFLAPREVVELLLVIGQYMTVARLAETSGIEVDDAVGMTVADAAKRDGGRA